MSSCIVEDELEAIQAVLSEDYKLIKDFKDENYTHCFQAFCFPSDDLDDCHCSVQLNIKIPNDYPNIIPSIQILSKDGISENTANNLLKHLQNRLNQQLNQEMLYDLIDLTKGYLQQYNFIGADLDETPSGNTNEHKQTEPGHPDFNEDDHVTFGGEEGCDDDDGFDDDDGGWSDIDQDDDDATFHKSLQSIEKIIEAEQKELEGKQGKNKKHVQIKYDVLKLEDVIDDDISSARLLAIADVYQLAMSKQHFYAECRAVHDGKDTYEVRIGVKISEYIKTKTLLNVLGLWEDDYMVIRLEFSKDYINNAKPPRIIEIGKSVPHKHPQGKKKKTVKGDDDEGKFVPIKLKNKLQPFIGSRSIMNRINNKLFARLWPPVHLQKYYPMKYKEILQLMAITSYGYDDCKAVLYYLKNYEKALVYLSKNDEETKDGTRANDDRQIKKEPVITAEIKELCDQLISYGMPEMLQPKTNKVEKVDSDDNDAKAEEFEDKETEQKSSKQSIEYQLNKFLKNTSGYFMHNILMQILYFALHSTLTLGKRCLVCDTEFPSYSGLIKPTVCKNTLCQYGYQELEIDLDIASMIKDSPEIIDLLLTFCYVCTKKGKINLFSPVQIHAESPNEHINFKMKYKPSTNPYVYQEEDPPESLEYNVLDRQKLLEVLSKMPSIDTLLSYAKKGGSKTIKRSLSYKSPLLWPLLKWLIVTNRSYLIPLRDKKEKFDGLPNCFQFKFISYSPEREYMFKELSRKNDDCGFRWAWHGSPIANWHIILRTGLKNMSGSKHMRNGAAFGSGIYLAPQSGTSYWYCEPSRSDTWPLSMFNKSDYYGRTLSTNTDLSKTKHTGHGLYCLALCQILNHPKLKAPEPYYVVPTESWVMLRYLFVFNTIDNKVGSNWKGKGRYFDINATKLIQNYMKKQEQMNEKK